MDEKHALLRNELRYGQRLCERTARYYRRLQAFGTFATVLGGGATLSALASAVPPGVSITGACVMSVFGAALIAIRPADKAATAEADMKRYARLLHESNGLDAVALRTAMDKLGEGDCPEVESLRPVAYNDIVREVGREDQVIPLKPHQRLLACIA